MNFMEFTEYVLNEVQMLLGEDYYLSLREVPKNNGVLLMGLVIAQRDCNISPTIYLNSFYREYENGRPVFSIARDIAEIYQRNEVCEKVDISFFSDFREVIPRLAYRLVHYGRNEELLQDLPYIRFLDLAIIFYCRVEAKGLESGTITIHNSHLKQWGVTVEEVYEAAKENTPKLYPFEIKELQEILRELLEEQVKQRMAGSNREERDWSEGWQEEWTNQMLTSMFPEGVMDAVNMYVLGNRERCQGAITILYKDVLKDFAGILQKNLYVLPCSVHEVILLPDEGKWSIAELSNMVKEVNATQLECQEILSDAVYFFDYQSGQLSVATA